MQLGTQTGSLVNHIKTTSTKETLPVVGKGATHFGWSDRHAYFVLWVSKDSREVVIERAKAIRTDNNGYYSEEQYYRFERPAEENRSFMKLRKRYGNWWILDDDGKPTSKFVVVFGYMDEYYDPTF